MPSAFWHSYRKYQVEILCYAQSYIRECTLNSCIHYHKDSLRTCQHGLRWHQNSHIGAFSTPHDHGYQFKEAKFSFYSVSNTKSITNTEYTHVRSKKNVVFFGPYLQQKKIIQLILLYYILLLLLIHNIDVFIMCTLAQNAIVFEWAH